MRATRRGNNVITTTRVQDSKDAYSRAEEELNKGNLEDAVSYCKRAIHRSPQFSPAYKTLGNIFLRAGMLDQAMSNFESFLTLSKRDNNISDIELAHSYIGSVFDENGEFDKALSRYMISVTSAEKRGDLKAMSKYYNNIALSYRRLHMWKMSKEFYDKSLRISKQINDSVNTAYYYFNVAFLYKEQGKTFKASRYLEKFKKLKIKLGIKDDNDIKKERQSK